MSAPGRPAPLGGWLALALAVVVIDQAAKALIVQRFALGQGIALLPVFDLLRAHNTGAAFSFLRDAGGWQRWFFSAIALAAAWIIVATLRKHGHDRLMGSALSLILGGAIGNLIDRMHLGYVVDFLHAHWGPHSFPVFNLADCAITLGAILLVLGELMRLRGRTAGF